ncbi:MAG: hypothetical protein LBJ15_19565 [Comamonas sp.]|jgi:hypothetical protein|uniref:hypothetical protein n=1 Tax=Comamonas sp. TaxID=34028 RepID=UPI0028383849|nr:hypothetical protein [Comamonas sp.]MDR0216174.1 hypothetical protein [Comamonas sp.]
MGQSLSFLERLIDKEPGNKELLNAYVELCKKDADMKNAAEDRNMKIMDNATNQRLDLMKQDAEIYKKQSDVMLSLNKAVLEAKNPPQNWPFLCYPPYQQHQALGIQNWKLPSY